MSNIFDIWLTVHTDLISCSKLGDQTKKAKFLKICLDSNYAVKNDNDTLQFTLIENCL